MKKRIWTFWEPKANIQPYIDLCMKTWEKFLPDYKVIVCDFDNLHEYIDKKTYKSIVFRKMTLSKQSDAIRAALIAQNGGIWMDADTIITKRDFIDNAHGNDVIMVGGQRPHTGKTFVYGAFIYAARAGTYFLNEWFHKLPARIKKYRLLSKSKILRRIFKKRWNRCENWDYLANAIIDDMAVKYKSPDFMLINKNDVDALPEYTSDLNKDGISGKDLYVKFYFEPGDADAVLKRNGGIILLHNSWTPEKYRKMSAEEFLSQDILISDLLRTLLKK
jgi:hypothetical protein